MKIETYNQAGKKEKELNLPKEIFEVGANFDLLHQVAVSQSSNRRQNSAHSKDRGEVSGGGKKPWKQKGTGRARAGSIRSPIWKGGGVTFGPSNERNYKREIPVKMKRKALLMAIALKAKDNELIVCQDLKFKDLKTKSVAEMIYNSPVAKQSFLLALAKNEAEVYKAAKNIAKSNIMPVANLNTFDILNSKYLVISENGIEEIKKIFVK